MNHFLDIHTTDATALRDMIDQAQAMKNARAGLPKGTPDADTPLAGHMVALIFEKPSTRTRVSFDVGVRQMGGETMVLSGADMQLGHGETIADTARVLSRYVDLIMMTWSSPARHRSTPRPISTGSIRSNVIPTSQSRAPIWSSQIRGCPCTTRNLRASAATTNCAAIR